ncbi:MBL fold metallo-hydrolase [Acidipila sp. EB88]|uniref:MBL fold metallo-hydrolase n=1 Tax=Acidipila sp. EB88 TaxID=2305226 RepID=UPI000F5DA384|nr:MBL fold metallo-hydrolase [Acidipila sp. EB88]RRA48180.1 MBL fold metallo-hydrolase [Acidipila sp. EB88]
MDKIAVREDQVVPMDAVAPNVRGLRIAFVNVFAVTHADGSWTLVDAAVPFTDGMIRRWAEHHFTRPPNAIVLTHGHFDHVSAAPSLSETWKVPVYAHALEFPYLTGEREYPAPNVGAGGGMMSLLSPLYPKGPVNLTGRLVELSTGMSQLMPGWEVIHTPGHTPGHCSLYQASDRTLLVGDAFCTTKPESFFEASIAQAPELHGPPAYFTSDWAAAQASVERLSAMDVAVVAPGHGKPLAGEDLGAELRLLAARFRAVAVPENRLSSV